MYLEAAWLPECAPQVGPISDFRRQEMHEMRVRAPDLGLQRVRTLEDVEVVGIVAEGVLQLRCDGVDAEQREDDQHGHHDAPEDPELAVDLKGERGLAMARCYMTPYNTVCCSTLAP